MSASAFATPELAAENPVRILHESAEYRAARTALLAEEIELRRHMERVAAQRRALPPGAPVRGDYRFHTEDGPTDLAGLFGDKETLCLYWPLGNVVITGPKVLDFYAGFCAHRATSLKSDGKDILSVTMVLNSDHSREDSGNLF